MLLKAGSLVGLAIALEGCGQDAKFKGANSSDQRPLRSLNLESQLPGFIDNIVQEDRLVVEVEETFNQSIEKPQLDLVLVIDDSASMAEEQEEISSKLPSLLQHISETDWRIAITTTDPRRNCLAVLRPGSNSVNAQFTSIIRRIGTNGSGYEAGFYKGLRALQENCNGENWVRSQSQLAVLIVSDEDNCNDGASGDSSCQGTNSAETTYWWQESKRIRDGKIRLYGLIHDPETEFCPQGYSAAPKYKSVIQESGGIFGSICGSYDKTLSGISANLSDYLRREFRLKKFPKEGTTIVMIDGVLIPATEYTADKDGRLLFNNAPKKGASIFVKYKSVAKEPKETFSFKKKIDSEVKLEYLQILINNEIQSASSYTIDLDKQNITFVTKPAPGDVITIQYVPPPPATVEFILPKTIPDVFEVQKDKVLLVEGRDFRFDRQNRILSLDYDASLLTATIKVVYRVNE